MSFVELFAHYGDGDIEGDSSAITIPSNNKEPEPFGLVGYENDEAFSFSEDSDSKFNQKRRGENFSDEDSYEQRGIDSTPSPCLVSPGTNANQSSDDVMSDTTPTTPRGTSIFLSKTNYSSWREEYPLNGSQVSPRLLETVQKFAQLRKGGGNINRDLRRNKSFKNPQYLEQLIEKNGLCETGSNFRTSTYNPKQWKETSFFESLSKEQAKLLDEENKKKEKEQFRKENDKKRPPLHRDDNRNTNKRYK